MTPKLGWHLEIPDIDYFRWFLERIAMCNAIDRVHLSR